MFLDANTNILSKFTLHPNSYFKNQVRAAGAALADKSLAQAVAKVADVGAFVWADSIANIGRLKQTLDDGVPCDHIVGLVVYNLPGRDCNAKAPRGELRTGEIQRYKTDFIDAVVNMIKGHYNTAFAVVVEPTSLANIVTNSDNQACKAATNEYRDGVAYAISKFNLPNVITYMDAANSEWLGWDKNLHPGADELVRVWAAAGRPSQMRGFSTNVANWNAWDQNPGEFAHDPNHQFNHCQNEKSYVDTFAPLLRAQGMRAYGLVDTSRNGVPGLRKNSSDWCNVKGAGMGARFTSNTGTPNADAFAWIKMPGESDGTSDSGRPGFDPNCGRDNAFKPAPDAGQWNQPFFEALVKNARPAI